MTATPKPIAQVVEELECLTNAPDKYGASVGVFPDIAALIADWKCKRDALEQIAAKHGMTLLYDCCVNGYCTALPSGESNCTHQFGVNRGFDECAAIAKDALRGGGWTT